MTTLEQLKAAHDPRADVCELVFRNLREDYAQAVLFALALAGQKNMIQMIRTRKRIRLTPKMFSVLIDALGEADRIAGHECEALGALNSLATLHGLSAPVTTGRPR